MEFSSFFWETVSDIKESWLTCGSCVRLTCSILLDLPLLVICICIKYPNLSDKTSLHTNFPDNLFHMKSHISYSYVSACESCMLGCVPLDCNGIKCTENGLSIPAAAFSQQLLRETNFPQVAISLLVWVQFWLLHSCIQFAVSADWEAQGNRVPSP